LRGTLHIFVAFDWGDAVDLDLARKLAAAETHALPRRRRTPPSFSYKPPPLHYDLPAVTLDLAEVGTVQAAAGVTVFDFAAVSLAMRVPFQLSAESLGRLASALAEPTKIVQTARAALDPLYKKLMPAVEDANWPDDMSEEYFVFELPPEPPLPPPEQLLSTTPGDVSPLLAQLVHLENSPLTKDEVTEALRLSLRYSPEDLFVPDWAAAVLVDRDCEETLHAIEFANLQLLEFRNIDNRLDDSMAAAYRLIHEMRKSSLPFWRMHARPLRALGELKVEANDLFERAGNVLKLVGDPYLARVYRLVATRFHLETWEKSIQRKLEVAEGIYQVVADQASHFRMEFLEILVAVLILIELLVAFFRH
jgi:hypothetical protein